MIHGPWIVKTFKIKSMNAEDFQSDLKGLSMLLKRTGEDQTRNVFYYELNGSCEMVHII